MDQTNKNVRDDFSYHQLNGMDRSGDQKLQIASFALTHNCCTGKQDHGHG
ncbi:Uncharacterised protein [Vibrio cholerae]|nr:Uncharacterised protein [Vibrio cholerae]